MSIKLENISKYYGDQAAVSDLSFEAKEGEILGLLGPNGAGKTTTMKILACYMPPDSGNAEIYGKSVYDDDLEIKSILGYLPEHNPLYNNMYIQEYLEFVADIHSLRSKRQRINEVLEITGLGPEKNKLISQLSKGYRQRVGIAQAIIHKPKVLILDEPISGLDPNQIIEIRSLISNLKSESTVIFSSHILQEVESICDKVIILDKGRLIANESIDKLSERNRPGQIITIEFQSNVDYDSLTEIHEDIAWEHKKANIYEAYCPSGKEYKAIIFDFAVKTNNRILEMSSSKESLESVFKSLTKPASL